jgi:hypothetical protein
MGLRVLLADSASYFQIILSKPRVYEVHYLEDIGNLPALCAALRVWCTYSEL